MALTTYYSGDSNTRASVVAAVNANTHAIGWLISGEAGAGLIRTTDGILAPVGDVVACLTAVDSNGTLVHGNAGLAFANGSLDLSETADDAAAQKLFTEGPSGVSTIAPLGPVDKPSFSTFKGSGLYNIGYGTLGVAVSGNIVAQFDGYNLQIYNIGASPATNPVNYERGGLLWSSNLLKIITQNGGTGVARDISLEPATGIIRVISGDAFRQSAGVGGTFYFDLGTVTFRDGNGAAGGSVVFTGRVVESKAAVTAASATTLDASTTNVFLVTLGTSITTFSVANSEDGQRITIIWRQDATGGHTVAFPAAIKGATAPSSGANTTSTQDFIYDATNSAWYAVGATGL